ncbi:hypothetical protein AALT_g11387 [Alternaria alternata]|nr:hypothetical protein AALT_g11387 [Alternaria alternata]
MATHTDAPPPYTPGTPEFTENTATKIEQVEAAHRAMRLQRYLLEIIAYSLPVDMPKLVKATPFEWPTYNGFHYMHRRIATSTLEDGRMLLVEAVEPSRTLNIDPGFTLQLMAAYADEHTKPWRQKRKRNLIADLVKYSYISDTGSHTWLYLNVISQLVLQLSPNHVVQKTLGLALEKYGRGRQHRQLGFMTDLGPRNVYYKGYNSLAEFLTGIPMVGENGTWQQLLALVPYENPVVPVTPWMSR